MEDITRSYVNISSKGQEKFKVVPQGNRRGQLIWNKLTMVIEILGEEQKWKTKLMSKCKKKKQTAQTYHVRKPRTNAGFGII